MIGAGGWGTAMMISLAGRHKDLVLYCRKPETAEKLNRERENKEYLPGVHLPEVIRITSDLKEAVEGAGCVVICTPSKAVADTAGKIAKWLEKDAVVVSASKGLADDEGHRLSEVIAQKVAGITDRIGCFVRTEPRRRSRRRPSMRNRCCL